MKDHAYSLRAAQSTGMALILAIGGLAVGHRLGADRGAGIGFLVGMVCFAAYLWHTRSRPQDENWVRTGRSLGLRSVYSGHIPPVALPDHDEILNALGGSLDGVPIILGDRHERYRIRHWDHTGDTSHSPEPEVSDPIPMETILVLWVPGLTTIRFSLGKRRSLLGDLAIHPSGPDATALVSWSDRNPAWRLDGIHDCLVLSRPRRLARDHELSLWLDQARSLIARLPARGTRQAPAA